MSLDTLLCLFVQRDTITATTFLLRAERYALLLYKFALHNTSLEFFFWRIGRILLH